MSKVFEAIKRQKDACRRTVKSVPDNKVKASILTTLVGELEGKTKGTGKEVTDELCFQTIKKFVKAIEETIPLVDSEKQARLTIEKETLQSHLPKQLSGDDLKINIRSIINSQSEPNIGSVMRDLKAEFDGQFNGAVASKMIKEGLNV